MDFPDEPEDFSPEDSLDTEAFLDRTPLKFGKYKGRTPESISEEDYSGKKYLIWAYETVGNFDVCSAALYRDCGGRGVRAKGTSGQANPAYRSGTRTSVPPDTYESRGYSKNPVPKDVRFPPGTPFSDDFDDDIPF